MEQQMITIIVIGEFLGHNIDCNHRFSAVMIKFGMSWRNFIMEIAFKAIVID